jgi:hypothetical protein
VTPATDLGVKTDNSQLQKRLWVFTQYWFLRTYIKKCTGGSGDKRGEGSARNATASTGVGGWGDRRNEMTAAADESGRQSGGCSNGGGGGGATAEEMHWWQRRQWGQGRAGNATASTSGEEGGKKNETMAAADESGHQRGFKPYIATSNQV